MNSNTALQSPLIREEPCSLKVNYSKGNNPRPKWSKTIYRKRKGTEVSTLYSTASQTLVREQVLWEKYYHRHYYE